MITLHEIQLANSFVLFVTDSETAESGRCCCCCCWR